ncbi:tyrosine-protein phosphatase [Pseudonocardia pini]|uniref:tyrosine-protein phosphatase n=1 Tax=Pseudonocardia pini TaxID=2758030 RepID=UPI0015F0F2C4|nr:tyrosine-protein phosphatase [Pseudonocardia pini]
MTPSPRWLDLDGAHNVRDVGGLRATDGRVVRPGVLLRGDHLEDLSAAGAAALCEGAGLRAVVDLRSPQENPLPGDWMTGRSVERLHLPLVDLTQSIGRHRDESGETDYVAAYGSMLDAAGPVLVEILRFLTGAGRLPALVHCAAGKDRTGITVAVLLAAAGVGEEDIVADYAVTGLRLARVRESLIRRGAYRGPQTPALPQPLDGAPIRAVLALLDRAGGAEAFLRRHGAREEELVAWRRVLLTADHEPAGTRRGSAR